MVILRIKLYKEKLDAEPRFHPKNKFALLEPSQIEDKLTATIAQIQEAIEKWTWM